MKNIEELRGLAVIEGKDLATYEYELLKDLYEENQEQQRILNKIKELIKEFNDNVSYLRWNEDDYVDYIKEIEKALEEIE